MIEEKWLLQKLAEYPAAHECFSDYVSWIFANIPRDQLKDYDLISVLIQGQKDRLARTEMLLAQAAQVLDMDSSQFCRAFGFGNNLLVADPEKIHDILAEPQVAVTLDTNGFSEVRKIVKPLKSNGNEIATADFLAMRDSYKYAVEAKTVRMEKGIEEGKPLGNALIPNWWGEMFLNNAVTKIEDKDKKVLDQLNNTADHFSCKRKMLVLYSRRLGPSTLLDEGEVMQALERLAARYNEIDTFCVMLYFGEVFFFPKLSASGESNGVQ